VSVKTARAAVVGLICAAVGLAAAAGPALAQSPPRLAVSAAAVYAPATGQTLLGVNADRELPMASTTKLMTALVVLQHVHDLSDVFTYPDYHQAASDSQIGLLPGDRMTVHDLVIAMMLPSADDAAEDLAFNVGRGSVARFVGMMNAEAKRLGLRHTHYSTPIGLDTPGNFTSASDLVHLADYDLTQFPFLAKVVDMPSATLATGPEREVTNLNDLVRDYPWIDGVKTGHTSGAGYVLVASGHRHGMRLISAVLGTDSSAARDVNSLAALDYGFDDFRTRTPIRAQQVVARPAVKDRPGLHVPVRAARSFTRILARSTHVRVRVTVPRRLAGPLPAGSVVGTAAVLAGGRVLDKVPVVLERRLRAVSRLTLAARFATRTGTLVAIIAVAALALAGLVVRSVRRGGGSGGGGRTASRARRDRSRKVAA
jgi:serine-type D-Ala-D-Ala carboxypeptidase (penicillin-binding protein 5/6)